MNTTPLPRIKRVDTIETEAHRGYVLDHVQVLFEDGRAPHVRVWYFAERDGFPAEVDYEIWNEADSRIIQEAQTIPGTGFDYSLVQVFAATDETEIESDSHVYGTKEIEVSNPEERYLPW